MLDDKLLIWKFNCGNRDVLRCVYEKYKDDLLTLAAALLNDRSAGEDVVHDVFVAFIEKNEKFKLTGSLKSYLATCVANLARNRIGTPRAKHSVSLDMAAYLDSPIHQPDTAALHNEQLRRLSCALAQLPYQQREVIMLHTHGHLKFRQIAKQLNISINTTQGRYRYGLDKLRSLMNGQVHHENTK